MDPLVETCRRKPVQLTTIMSSQNATMEIDQHCQPLMRDTKTRPKKNFFLQEHHNTTRECDLVKVYENYLLTH